MAAHAKMRYMLRDNVSQAAEKETTERCASQRERESRSTKEDEAKFVEIEEEARGLGFRRNRRRDWHLREMHFI